jgi:hypothetical protein
MPDRIAAVLVQRTSAWLPAYELYLSTEGAQRVALSNCIDLASSLRESGVLVFWLDAVG